VQKGDLDAFIGVAADERKSDALLAPTGRRQRGEPAEGSG